MADLQQIATDVIEGHADAVDRGVRAALAAGVGAQTILDEALTAGMAVVGARFRANEIFVPEVLIAARALKAGLAHLEPIFTASGIPRVGTVVLGTVKGDIHDIGKNLVGMMLQGAGFKVVDLGVNVPAESFLKAIREHQPQIVGMSALLTTTMGAMATNIAALRASGADVKVLVGGAPVNAEFAQRIGADGYGANATDAVTQALRLVGRL